MPLDFEDEQRFRTQIQAWVEVDIESKFVRREVLGEALSFEAGRPTFELGKSLTKFMSTSIDELVRLPDSQLLADRLASLHESLIDIADFSPDKHDSPVQVRDQMLKDTGRLMDSLQSALIPNVGYLMLHTGGFERFRGNFDDFVATARKQIKDVITEAKSDLTRAESDATEAASRAKEAADAAQSAAGVTGVALHSNEFGCEAKKQQNAGWRWLIAGSILMALVIGLSFYFFHNISDNQEISDPRTIQQIFLRLLVVTSLSYVTILAFRMFRTERHLAVGNQHRQLALATFETFAQGSKDDTTKDAVLLEATRAIFAHPSTGLVGKPESQSHSSSMLEVIRNQSQRE